MNWEHHHPILENDTFAALGDDGACPYLLPIGDDKRLLLHFSHKSGGKYVVGRYDMENMKLYAENGGSFNSNSWFSGVHAPSAYSDGKGVYLGARVSAWREQYRRFGHISRQRR